MSKQSRPPRDDTLRLGAAGFSDLQEQTGAAGVDERDVFESHGARSMRLRARKPRPMGIDEIVELDPRLIVEAEVLHETPIQEYRGILVDEYQAIGPRNTSWPRLSPAGQAALSVNPIDDTSVILARAGAGRKGPWCGAAWDGLAPAAVKATVSPCSSASDALLMHRAHPGQHKLGDGAREFRGLWPRIFAALAAQAELPGDLSIDSTAMRAHRSAHGGKGGRKFRPSGARVAVQPPKSTH